MAGSNTTMDYYDSGYVYVEQLPLIKMSLTKHYGHELDDKNSVFSLSNTRTVIFLIKKKAIRFYKVKNEFFSHLNQEKKVQLKLYFQQLIMNVDHTKPFLLVI